MPSTVKESPAGLVCTETEMVPLGAKPAVSVTGPFMVTEAALLPPEYDPVPLPDQLLKL